MAGGRIDELLSQLRGGDLSRRDFMRRASALGVSTAAAGMMANSALAQATPEASPAASPVAIASIAPPTRAEVLQTVKDTWDISEPQATGGQVIYAQTTDIDTMNALIASDTYSALVSGWVNEFLISVSPVDGSFTPGLADTWDVSSDGLTYTFKLHPGITWHDGTPFTSADVVFSFDATLDENTLSPRRSSVMQYLDSYRAVDDLTVEFIAKDVFATFLDNTVGLVAIMPKHIWEGVPAADWGTDPGSTGQDPTRVVGTGPGLFVEWVTGDHVTIKKNPDYWDKDWVWNIDEWTYRVIPEASAATQALLTGEVDISDISEAEAPTLTDNPDITLTAFDTSGVNWYSANQDPSKTELFTDVKVRQALMYALDRKLLAEQVYNGYAIQADGMQPVLSIAYRPEGTDTIYDFDVEKAKSLLEEAGWTDTDGDGIRDKDGVKFSFECLYSEGVATYEQQLPYMQQAWADVGLEMKPTAVPFTALLDGTDTGNYQMAVYGFNWGSSPDGNELAMFGCDFIPPQGFNSMRYCNPEYDKLSIEADKVLPRDGDERIKMLTQASNIVNDEQAAGYLLFRQDIFGNRKTLHNFYPNGHTNWWSLSFVWTEVQ
jgi:peptide/nickel transport system substrate-binding protein